MDENHIVIRKINKAGDSSSVVDSLTAAKRIIDQAHQEAQRVTELTRNECSIQLEIVEAEAKSKAVKELLQIQVENKQLRNELETASVELALKIAGEVIGDELKTNRESISQRVKRGMKGLVEERKYEIIVNPKSVKIVKEGLSSLSSSYDFTVITDDKIAEHDAVIRSGNVQIETSIEHHFATISEVCRS